MPSPINSALLQISKRAESNNAERLVQTFVDVGPLATLLQNNDHQVMFGRRGTGKTHALHFLESLKRNEGHIVCEIDLRNVGSNGGLYADESTPLAVRATSLLIDTLGSIYDQILQACIENAERWNLAETGPVLDEIARAITQVKVVGNVETEDQNSNSTSRKAKVALGGSIQKGILSLSADLANEESLETSNARIKRQSGSEILYINFGSLGAAFNKMLRALNNVGLYILLDEWSSAPLVLQPYLGDFIRRCLLPLRGVVVKIAAIEHRSNFRVTRNLNDYIGLELGADIAADINLDDFMVFDNDPERAIEFFEALIGGHVVSLTDPSVEDSGIPSNPRAIFQSVFTEKRAVEEFVRSCEGVPRDAINIASLAAQRAVDRKISVNDIRVAAKNWYQRDKEKSVSADSESYDLLHRVVSEVIGKRKARAFLFRSNQKHKTIDTLYDARILHILKRGVSTHDQPGVRYDVYKIDYGCYVDLLSTNNAPQGLLIDDAGSYIEVPPDDYRSIRRAILTL